MVVTKAGDSRSPHFILGYWVRVKEVVRIENLQSSSTVADRVKP